MISADKKPEEKNTVWQKIIVFIPVWIQIIICIGGVAAVIAPLAFQKFISPDTPTATPTTNIPTETLTELPPVVNTNIPSAPTLSPIMWDIFSSDGASFAAFPYEGCPNIVVNELGFFASNCNLIFGKRDIKQHGVYGLSMPIQHNVTIQVSVTVRELIEGEFWIGFSNEINPQLDSLIYAIPPDPGGVDVYLNNISSRNARYSWAPMGQDVNWESGQPRKYNFTIKLVGNNVSAAVNSTTFTTVVASSTDRLFLGYRSKPEGIGTYVDATISGLTITANP